jgi:hypothetical protein
LLPGPPPIGDGNSKVPAAVAGLLALLVGGVYLQTLHPGVGRGDAAELQYAAASLGVCHPPGYAIEVTFGRLISRLPLGPGVAWRVNLMMAVCGVVGCLAVYGTVRRVTRQVVPAVGAATILGFSSVYWAHSVLAEAYVFYGMFLLLATYAAARFVAGGKTWWLYLAALLLGTCIGGRVSEAAVLPAFGVLWLAHRRQARLTPGRLVVSLVLLAVPFVYSAMFVMVRFDPGQPYARDDFARRRILGEGPAFPERGTAAHAAYATRYCLGLEWAERVPHSAERLWWDVDKYAWLLSGLGGLGDRFEREDAATHARQLQQGRGASIGALGVALALLAVGLGRRQWGWVLFGLGLFAGNTAFYLAYQAVNNLDFTIPGLAGLALLAGLGAGAVTGPRRSRPLRLAGQVACLLVPLLLLVANYRFMNRSTEAERARVAHCLQLVQAPLPPDSVIISQRNSGMVYRYVYHVEAGRPDVAVINAAPPDWAPLFRHFLGAGRPTFVRAPPGNRSQLGPAPMPGDKIRADYRARWRLQTPAPLAEFGFLAVTPD